MVMSALQQVRLRIADFPSIADLTYASDGSGSAFNLQHRNITSGTAFVLGSNSQWSATAAAFDAPGIVTFSAVISANSAYRVRYVYSTFSDDEINNWLDVGGTVAGASLEAVQTLMFDSLRRASWRAPDGSSYDDKLALSDLKALYDVLRDVQDDEAFGGGGVESWSINQELY